MKRSIVCIAISFLIPGMVFSTEYALNSMDLKSMQYPEDDLVMVLSSGVTKISNVDDGAKCIEFECPCSIDGSTDISGNLESESNSLKFCSENPLTTADMLKNADLRVDMKKKRNSLTAENMLKKAGVDDDAKSNRRICIYSRTGFTNAGVDMEKKIDSLTTAGMLKKEDSIFSTIKAQYDN